LRFVTAKDRYKVTAYVNNIEDRRVIQQATYASPPSVIGVTRSDSRTFGLRVTAKVSVGSPFRVLAARSEEISL